MTWPIDDGSRTPPHGDALKRTEADRYMVIVKVDGLPDRDEWHLFSGRHEAVDYIDVILLGVQTEDLAALSVDLVVVPTCFEPTEEVVIHDAR